MYQRQLQDADNKIITQNEYFNQLFEDYKLLLDNQLVLKTEIKILKKLIEGEEKRLNIGPSDKPLKRKSSISLANSESMFTVNATSEEDSDLVFNDWNIALNCICIKNISEVIFVNIVRFYFRKVSICLYMVFLLKIKMEKNMDSLILVNVVIWILSRLEQ